MALHDVLVVWIPTTAEAAIICYAMLFFSHFTALWVFLTLLPSLILNSKTEDRQLCTRDYVGWGIWLIGIMIESVADFQKYSFRSDPANKYVTIIIVLSLGLSIIGASMSEPHIDELNR